MPSNKEQIVKENKLEFRAGEFFELLSVLLSFVAVLLLLLPLEAIFPWERFLSGLWLVFAVYYWRRKTIQETQSKNKLNPPEIKR